MKYKLYLIMTIFCFSFVGRIEAQHYQNYSQVWDWRDFVVDSGGGGGRVTMMIENDLLTVTFSAGFSSSALKRGRIKELNTIPALPDINLGEIAGAYNVSIESGGLYVKAQSPYDVSGFSATFRIGLKALTNENDLYLTKEKNYILTISPTKQGIRSADSIVGEVAVREVKYYDGLGRLAQTISMKGSPNEKDLVVPIQYDDFGREKRQYLSYESSNSTNGTYHSSPFASGNWNEHYGSEAINAFTVKKYDNSPLNRVVEQGAPGAIWQPKPRENDFTGHTVKFEYATNQGIDNVILFTLNNNELENKAYYLDNQLYKTIIKNENWQNHSIDELNKLNTTEEFKDRLEQVVLKRTYVEDGNDSGTDIDILDTYYVYDDYGLLRFVLPPKAIEQMFGGIQEVTSTVLIKDAQTLYAPESTVNHYLVEENGSLTLGTGFTFSATSANSLTISSGSIQSDLCYSYKYDSRKRMIEKKIPGAKPVYMVYDSRDRLVATQDGNQRNFKDNNGNQSPRWLVTKYDFLNRPVMTGFYINGKDQDGLQTEVSDFYAIATNPMFETRGGSFNSYTNNSFPKNLPESNVFTVSYYDNYTYGADCIGFETASSKNISGTTYMSTVKGLVTGSKERILGADDGSWLTTTNYYDKKYRVIQAQQKLVLKESGAISTFTDCISNKYDFVGKVERTVQTHNSPKLSQAQIIDKSFTYDHAGRLLEVAQTMSGAINKARTVISTMAYDELGQLKTKSYHGGQQPMNYKYNIRGWLESINDPNSLGSSMFAMKLLYNNTGEISGVSNSAQYNGNIGGMLWRSKNISGATSSLRAYGYTYDALNRIKQADYEEKGSTWSTINKFDVTGNESGIAYDLNGNIENLKRYNSSSAVKDDFHYRYLGNQLMALGEGTAAPISNEFTYDANGNMTANSNKSISNLVYNELNLPKGMTVNSKTVTYAYTASGTKIRNQIGTKNSYYIGNFVYEGSSLKYILQDEGRIVVNGSSAIYEYHLKDHLGNTRVAFQENQSSPIQSTDYYPFGLAMNMSEGSSNKYLYNGKELQEETDWLDYGARMYDASLGRWHCVDPLAELRFDFTPYHYVSNNPINRIDPNGMVDVAYGMDLGQMQEMYGANNVQISSYSSSGNNDSSETGSSGSEKGYYETSVENSMKGLSLNTQLGEDTSSKESATRAIDYIANYSAGIPGVNSGAVAGQYVNSGQYGYATLWTVIGAVEACTLGTFKMSSFFKTPSFAAKGSSFLRGGKTFSQYKVARGGTQTLAKISTSTGTQRISTEFHHVFLTQRMQRAYGLPNWLVNNGMNVWKLNTVQHSLIDSYRYKFLRAGFKSDVGFFGNYNWFTKF